MMATMNDRDFLKPTLLGTEPQDGVTDAPARTSQDFSNWADASDFMYTTEGILALLVVNLVKSHDIDFAAFEKDVRGMAWFWRTSGHPYRAYLHELWLKNTKDMIHLNENKIHVMPETRA